MIYSFTLCLSSLLHVIYGVYTAKENLQKFCKRSCLADRHNDQSAAIWRHLPWVFISDPPSQCKKFHLLWEYWLTIYFIFSVLKESFKNILWSLREHLARWSKVTNAYAHDFTTTILTWKQSEALFLRTKMRIWSQPVSAWALLCRPDHYSVKNSLFQCYYL